MAIEVARRRNDNLALKLQEVQLCAERLRNVCDGLIALASPDDPTLLAKMKIAYCAASECAAALSAAQRKLP